MHVTCEMSAGQNEAGVVQDMIDCLPEQKLAHICATGLKLLAEGVNKQS